MLHLAWSEKGKYAVRHELNAYDGLAQINYYMGEIKKADFYFERFMSCKTENSNSVIKKVVAGRVLGQRYNKEFRLTNNLGKQVIDNQNKGPSNL